MATGISYLCTFKTSFLGVTICVMPCYFAVWVLRIIAALFLAINADIVVFVVGSRDLHCEETLRCCVASNLSLLDLTHKGSWSLKLVPCLSSCYYYFNQPLKLPFNYTVKSERS